MGKDFYEILGVQKGATEDEIKRAYRKLAQKHHPDTNKGEKSSDAKFKEINAAYEVLGDKKKRQQYDQFGEAAFGGGSGGGPFGGAGGFPGGVDFGGFQGFGESFADMFEGFFGGGGAGGTASGGRGRKSGQAPGDDREASLSVSFEEAAFGAEKEVKLSRIGECAACRGSGAATGAKIVNCAACGGAGEIRSVRQTIIGQLATRRVCDTCTGEGRIPERPCSICHGVGRVRLSEKLTVKVPAGITDGLTIRINGRGDSGVRGGESGDLFVHIHVQAHKFFERKGADVYSEQYIHIAQAALGDEIDVKTIHGNVKMKVPAGTLSGKILKLRGHGAPKLKGDSKGDHYVTIRVRVPEKLTRRERELYEELAKEGGVKLKEDEGIFKKFF